MENKYVVYVWQFMTPPGEYAARAHLPQKRVVVEVYDTELEATQAVKQLRLGGDNAHFERMPADRVEEAT